MSKKSVEYYRALGFQTAIDEFGAGFLSGLGLIGKFFQTDISQLDMGLIPWHCTDNARQIMEVEKLSDMFNEFRYSPIW